MHSLLMINFYFVYNRFDWNVRRGNTGWMYLFVRSFLLFTALISFISHCAAPRILFTVSWLWCDSLFSFFLPFLYFISIQMYFQIYEVEIFLKTVFFCIRLLFLCSLDIHSHTLANSPHWHTHRFHSCFMLFNKQDTFVFIFIFSYRIFPFSEHRIRNVLNAIECVGKQKYIQYLYIRYNPYCSMK